MVPLRPSVGTPFLSTSVLLNQRTPPYPIHGRPVSRRHSACIACEWFITDTKSVKNVSISLPLMTGRQGPWSS